MSLPFDPTTRDLALIARIRANDERALDTLMRVYAESLYRFAYVRTRDAQLAEDAAQDVFVHLWERRAQLHIHGNVKSYLLQSVRNRALDMLRSHHAYLRLEQTIEAFAPLAGARNDGEVRLEEEEIAQVIRDALATLPPRAREIFLLHRDEGMSYAEIAHTLNIGIPTIHNQMSRATKVILSAVQRWRSAG